MKKFKLNTKGDYEYYCVDCKRKWYTYVEPIVYEDGKVQYENQCPPCFDVQDKERMLSDSEYFEICMEQGIFNLDVLEEGRDYYYEKA